MNIPNYNTINLNTLNRDRPRKICFYGRVSTEHEAQLSALENQIQWYDNQLLLHDNWELVKKYIDRGITGTQAKKRPAFLKMIEDAKKGMFDLIVTREVSRFARNTVDTLVYTRKLKSEYGIEVYFVDDNIWTMDNDGELRLTIMATLAQDASRKTSERVKAGQKISRDKGVLYGNGNILGYDLKRNIDMNGKWDSTENTYVINPEQAETVRMIYQLYLNGLGERKIMNEMMRLKRKDANGNVKWSGSKIDRILKKSTYKGVITYNQSYNNNYLEQKRIKNKDISTYMYKKVKIPPIISEEDWNEVQRIMKSKTTKIDGTSRTDLKTKGKKRSEDVWLRKLKCKCGSSFRKNKWRTNKSGEDVFGYQCYNQVNNGSKQFRLKNNLNTDGYCDIRMIGDWKLDFMAKNIISEIWGNRNQSIIMAYEMILKCYEEESDHNISKKNILLEIDKNKNKINNLIELKINNDITKDEYAYMRKKLEDKIISLKDKLNECIEKKDIEKELQNKLNSIKTFLNETIDFSKSKLPEYVVEKFVYKVTPIDNNTFRWYINLNNIDNNDIDEDLIDEIDVEITGRKNNASFSFINNNDNSENSLPYNQNGTGCIETKIGYFKNLSNTYQIKVGDEYKIIIRYTIPFETARDYRKRCNKYLRYRQWSDLNIEIIII